MGQNADKNTIKHQAFMEGKYYGEKGREIATWILDGLKQRHGQAAVDAFFEGKKEGKKLRVEMTSE